MAEPTKAQITYTVGSGVDQVTRSLRFHAIIAEDHLVESEITKYPAQVGFDVSRHVIHKNRKVSLTGLISNHMIVNAEEYEIDSGNNQRLGYSLLKELIAAAVVCQVQTNLTTYKDVIFNRFKTKTEVGMADSMKFTFAGEEIQPGDAVNDTTPTLLSFTPLTPEQAEARAAELRAAGILLSPDDVLSEAVVDMSKSYQIATVNGAGTPQTITYEKVGFNPSTNSFKHLVHTTDVLLHQIAEDVISDVISTTVGSLPDIGTQFGGVFSAASLIPKDILSITGSSLNLTPLGELAESAYGAAYENVTAGVGQAFGQIMPGLAESTAVLGKVANNGLSIVAEGVNLATDGVGLITDGLGLAADLTGNSLVSTLASVARDSILNTAQEKILSEGERALSRVKEELASALDIVDESVIASVLGVDDMLLGASRIGEELVGNVTQSALAVLTKVTNPLTGDAP